jgi:hypothetical protein
MNMPVPVGVIRAAAARLLIAHDAQDARRICLQHINNNHRNATAKDSQTPRPGPVPRELKERVSCLRS